MGVCRGMASQTGIVGEQDLGGSVQEEESK